MIASFHQINYEQLVLLHGEILLVQVGVLESSFGLVLNAVSSHIDQQIVDPQVFDLLGCEFRESNEETHGDLLSPGQLVLSSSHGLSDNWDVFFFGSQRQQNVSNLNPTGLSVGFTPGASHSGLKSISAGAGKHFVDSEHVPWVLSDSDVEVFLADFLDEESVGGDSHSLKSLGTDLLFFV